MITRRATDEVQSLIRMAGWAVALPVLRRIWSVQKIQETMSPGRLGASQESPLPWLTLRLWHALYNRPSANCLERSLQLIAFLRGHGRSVRLAMGFRKQGDKVLGHAWVTTEAGEPVFRELGCRGEDYLEPGLHSDDRATISV